MSTFMNNKIRLLRLSRQMKQEEVARKMGITIQRYSQLENHPNLKIEREEEIIVMLGYTICTAKKYLESIPPPHTHRINKILY